MSIFKKVYNVSSSDFLVEIGCEELPAKSLLKLATNFADKVIIGLQKRGINHGPRQIFATPRRLAVLIERLDQQQAETMIDRKGPMLVNAFTADGQPTSAAIGFANSCNVTVNELKKLDTSKGPCLFYQQKKVGVKTEQLLPEIVTEALDTLPIARPMSWNEGLFTFVRPVHWIVMLFGDTPMKAEFFGIKAGSETFGHRFLYPDSIRLKHSQDYAVILEKQGYVIADFEKRKEKIQQLLKNIAPKNGDVLIDEDLLHEVTGIVEWPVALLGKFDERFLQLPTEVLITSIQKHQKSFPVRLKVEGGNIPIEFQDLARRERSRAADRTQTYVSSEAILQQRQSLKVEGYSLLSCFATISNIKSLQPERVIKGNERIVNARLSDADFFYKTDIKKSLEDYLQNLTGIIFQTGLGNMHDKAKRLSNLAEFIAIKISADVKLAKRAGMLAKADLATEMVGEFPELQGIMGGYYALNSQESEEVAIAIKEQYLPGYAGDHLPSTVIGSMVAIADRIDLLVGMIGINKVPTGDKDPLGLRRAALGVIRIIVEKEMDLDLRELITFSKDSYNSLSLQVVDKTLEFIYERLRGYCYEKEITPQIFNAVFALKPTNLLDFNERIKAVLAFNQLPEAESLAIANKRVHNILQKSDIVTIGEVQKHLLIEKYEKELAEQITIKESEIEQLRGNRQYAQLLKSLATLKPVIDNFFDQVMVMVDDEKLRTNRLALLSQLRKLFLHCADISVL